MNEEEIFENLCINDPRSPYFDVDYWEDDTPSPRENCFCNNCFYHRNELALEIIRLKKELQHSAK